MMSSMTDGNGIFGQCQLRAIHEFMNAEEKKKFTAEALNNK